jgi:hypothetical protein
MRAWRHLILALLVATPAALAHSPGALEPGQVFVVEDATISRALYGEFKQGDELFIIRLTFNEDFALPMELLVPHRDELSDHRPAYALVGPGMPAPSEQERGALPRPLPEGAGAFVELHQRSPRPVFYESFTRRYFWGSGGVALVVPRGTYELWLWSPRRTVGQFNIGFGVEEDVDFSEVLRNWSRYGY